MCWPYELAGLSKCCCKSYGGCNNKLWVPYSVVKQWAYIRGLQLQEKQLPSLTTVNQIYLLLIRHQPDIKVCTGKWIAMWQLRLISEAGLPVS